MKQILLITIILSIGIVSSIYAGETVEIPLEFEIINCSVISSTYDLEGLNLSWYGKNITLTTSPYYQPDNLTISCWIIKCGEIVEEHYSSGGSSSHSSSRSLNTTIPSLDNYSNPEDYPRYYGEVTENLTELPEETVLIEPFKSNLWKYIIYISASLWLLLIIILVVILRRNR